MREPTATALALALFPGFWQLSSIQRTQHGQPIADITYGEHPSGSIQYTPDGHMSAVLTSTTPTDRPENLTLPAQPDQPDALWALVGRHTLAYSGPWTVQSSELVAAEGSTEEEKGAGGGLGKGAELKGLVVHGNLTTATLPRFVGSQQRRNFTFSEEGKRLVLIGDLGNGVIDTLVWLKAPRHRTTA